MEYSVSFWRSRVGASLSKQKSMVVWALLGLVLVGLGCGALPSLADFTVEATATPFVLTGPRSTFVPQRDLVLVQTGEALTLESYHVSNVKLKRLDILVNGQKIRTEATSASGGTFSPDLATVQIVSDDQPVVAANATPSLSTSAWTISLQWVGHIPGTYELTLQVTDSNEQTSDPVTQRIEVR